MTTNEDEYQRLDAAANELYSYIGDAPSVVETIEDAVSWFDGAKEIMSRYCLTSQYRTVASCKGLLRRDDLASSFNLAVDELNNHIRNDITMGLKLLHLPHHAAAIEKTVGHYKLIRDSYSTTIYIDGREISFGRKERAKMIVAAFLDNPRHRLYQDEFYNIIGTSDSHLVSDAVSKTRNLLKEYCHQGINPISTLQTLMTLRPYYELCTDW